MNHDDHKEETDPLLPNKGHNKEPQSRDDHLVSVPFHRSLVEIVLVLIVIAGLLMMLTVQLFIYNTVTKKYTNTTLVKLAACNTTNASDPAFQLEQKIQQESSSWMMSLTFCLTLPSVFCTLLVGTLTDRYGRKFGMVLVLLASTFRGVVVLIVMLFDLPLTYLFIGYFVEGLSGSFGTMLMAGFSYVSDVTDSNRQRAIRITVAEASCAVGGGLASLCGGFWIDAYGYIGPTITFIVMNLVNILIVIFYLKETVRTGRGTYRNYFSQIKQSFSVFYYDTPDKRRWKLVTVMLAFFFTAPAALAKGDVTTLFMLNIPLCWDSVKIGIYSFISIVVSWIFILIVVKILQRAGMPERGSTIIGYIFSITYLTLLTFANSDIWMFSIILVGALSFISLPMIRTMLSKLVSPSELGSVFSVMAAVEMLCLLVFNLVFNSVYQATLWITPGFVFSVIALAQFLAFCIMIFYNVRIHREKKDVELLTSVQ